jgi:hypothetical protein
LSSRRLTLHLIILILLSSVANRSAQAQTGSFSVSVSPNPIVFAAGTTGSGNVTVAPGAGFSGSVSLACATGAPVAVAGYGCVFSPATVALNGVSTTSALSLTPTTTTAGAVNTARLRKERIPLFTASIAASLLLFGLLSLVPSDRQTARNFLFLSGLVLATLSALSACGGGGGSSGNGGQVSTTTTISSSNLHVGFGTGVTFSITVKPNGNATPSGQVQLYDNGQPFGQATQAVGGVASFLATSLPVGINTMTAQYLGDAHTLPSTSAPIMQLIAGMVTMQVNGTSGTTAETSSLTVNVL